MAKQLHIVCFDAPSPPDYGGAVDQYCKIKALSNAGFGIHLHYFAYKEGRGRQGLGPYCTTISQYERKNFWQCMRSPLPYIVSSRVNKELVAQLNADQDPVLLEGIHCTGILPFLNKEKKLLLRLHNNEAVYYRNLALSERRPLQNLFFSMEATRLERHQKKLPFTIPYAALSSSDLSYFRDRLGWNTGQFIPAFIPWQKLAIPEGTGEYCLYHGNLSVPENEAVLHWLLQHVFSRGSIPFVVAGKAPSVRLQRRIEKMAQVRLVANPSEADMGGLVAGAQVHVLPSLNSTGVKLKMLHALFNGRHCIANSVATAGSGLEELVHVAEDAGHIHELASRLMEQKVTQEEKENRTAVLSLYDNRKNAALLAQALEGR